MIRLFDTGPTFHLINNSATMRATGAGLGALQAPNLVRPTFNNGSPTFNNGSIVGLSRRGDRSAMFEIGGEFGVSFFRENGAKRILRTGTDARFPL